MKYGIEITDAAQRDFENIYMYISDNLCNKHAALRIINLIDENIRSLGDMPAEYPLVKDEYLRNIGIRCVPVKNYIIFYTISQDKQKVYIIRVLYGKRNWLDILHSDL